MPINVPDKKGSGLANLVGLAGKAAAVATGDPTQIAGAAVPGVSALQKAVGSFGGSAPASAPAAGAQPDAMGRRIADAQNSPEAVLHQGLQLADDPNMPLDYETRMAVIEPLLRAKHFGPGGGLA